MYKGLVLLCRRNLSLSYRCNTLALAHFLCLLFDTNLVGLTAMIVNSTRMSKLTMTCQSRQSRIRYTNLLYGNTNILAVYFSIDSELDKIASFRLSSHRVWSISKQKHLYAMYAMGGIYKISTTTYDRKYCHMIDIA